MHSPQSLFNTTCIWYLNTKLFGFWRGHESWQLRWGDITLHCDSEGDEYLQFRESLSKTRQGNSSTRAFAPKVYSNKQNKDRCPVEAFKLYQSHRPSEYKTPESPFYVAINNSWTLESHYISYKNAPMGQKTLSCVMKNVKAELGQKKL